jgi:hypothetical protein
LKILDRAEDVRAMGKGMVVSFSPGRRYASHVENKHFKHPIHPLLNEVTYVLAPTIRPIGH